MRREQVQCGWEMNAEVSPETSTWGILARPQKPETGSRVCSSPFPIFQCTCTIHNRAPAEIRATSSSSSSFSWPSLPPPGAASGGVSTPRRLPPVLGTVTRRRSRYFSGSGRQESQGRAVWRRGWDSNPQRPRGLAVFKFGDSCSSSWVECERVHAC